MIACGALARELNYIVDRAQLRNIVIECLPAKLHNRPSRIPDAVAAKIRDATGRYERIFVAYADCGTGGRLDDVLAQFRVERLPGAHCYEFFADGDAFETLHDEEPATFYLTDFLARHFERLVWQGLGLDRYPELQRDYFGAYRRVVYLSQTRDETLVTAAEAAAARLGLPLHHLHVGYGHLERSIVALRDREHPGRAE